MDVTVSHFYFKYYNPIDARPKTLTGLWHVTDTMINSTVHMHSCFQEKLGGFVIWMLYNITPIMMHQQPSLNARFLLNEKGYCLSLSSASNYSEDYT